MDERGPCENGRGWRVNTIRKLVDELEGIAAIAGSGRNTPVYSDHGEIEVDLKAGRVCLSLTGADNAEAEALDARESLDESTEELGRMRSLAKDLFNAVSDKDEEAIDAAMKNLEPLI